MATIDGFHICITLHHSVVVIAEAEISLVGMGGRMFGSQFLPFSLLQTHPHTHTDPKEDTTLTLDGRTVTVAQGKPLPTQYATSRFSQSEYLVYKESQTRIRYMLQLKFQ